MLECTCDGALHIGEGLGFHSSVAQMIHLPDRECVVPSYNRTNVLRGSP